jgi:hypothetical protein
VAQKRKNGNHPIDPDSTVSARSVGHEFPDRSGDCSHPTGISTPGLRDLHSTEKIEFLDRVMPTERRKFGIDNSKLTNAEPSMNRKLSGTTVYLSHECENANDSIRVHRDGESIEIESQHERD